MQDIFLVSYKCSDGEYVFATVESHCRIAAIHRATLAEARGGREVVLGVAELMCPATLLNQRG